MSVCIKEGNPSIFMLSGLVRDSKFIIEVPRQCPVHVYNIHGASLSNIDSPFSIFAYMLPSKSTSLFAVL